MVSKTNNFKKKRLNRRKKTGGKVLAMPRLVFKNAQLPEQIRTNEIEPDKLTGEECDTQPSNHAFLEAPANYFAYNKQEKEARRWMWVGVVSFLAMIVVLWGWSLFLQMTRLAWKKGSDYSLISDARKNWDSLIIKNKEEKRQDELRKQEIIAALRQMVTQKLITSATSTANVTNTTATPEHK